MDKNKMLAAASAAMLLCSCSSAEDSSSKDESGYFEMLGEAFLEAGNVSEAVTDFSALSREKHGYGQGIQLDDKNRPAGALDFNSVYGKYSAKAINETEDKTITLTFDQGYENGYTAGILDTLKEKNVKAIFFVLQDYAEKNPELVRRMIDEGHTVGNHSVSHRSVPGLSEAECREEILGLHKYITDNFGYDMTLFRPPMGEFSELSLAVTQSCGYETVLWSYAYADWDVNDQPEPSAALKKLTGALHSGAIYLLHSVSKTNAEILGSFIDAALAEGYTFV